MREISASLITDTVARLCEEANFKLGEDVLYITANHLENEEKFKKLFEL